MAPTTPHKKRPSIRTKTSSSKSGSGLITRPSHTNAIVSDTFINSKKDKRTIKHSAFVNRIEKAHRKPLKRRRPGKKLVGGDLKGLEDVLGEIGEEGGLGGEGRGEGGKMKLRTLKQGSGALKRKVMMERGERERFGRNMAQLIGTAIQPQPQPQTQGNGQAMEVEGEKEKEVNATSSRWAALRGFISQTMEQKEEFRKP